MRFRKQIILRLKREYTNTCLACMHSHARLPEVALTGGFRAADARSKVTKATILTSRSKDKREEKEKSKKRKGE